MNPLITKMAIENRAQRQRQKVVTLPKTDDVQELFIFTCKNIKECIKQLEINFDGNTWTNLSKNLLVAIMIFNRKRPGEIEQAQLLDYKNCETIDEDSKVGFEAQEQSLAKVFGRFTILG
ncbi:hypothetical protein JTB14_012397 [Gonioctena quinquepunctata]|nr:hypothetical protein JTB14_012397 [Gonioctena quinquepunctata]